MNKYKQRFKYVLSDFIAAFVTWLLFNWLRYEDVAIYEGFASLEAYMSYHQVWKGQLLVPFFWLILFYLSGYYNKPFGKSRLTEFFSTFISIASGVVFVFFVIVLNDLPRSYEIYYELFFALWGIQFVLTYFPRLYITQNGLRRIKRREWATHVLLIGTGEKACSVANGLYKSGYEIAGFVTLPEAGNANIDKGKVLGEMSDLPVIMKNYKIDELVVAVSSKDNRQFLDIVYSLYVYKLPIKVLSDDSSVLARTNIKTIQGVPLIDITDNNLLEAEKNIKFILDKFVSILLLILLFPVFLYIAWRVKKDSPGPVFFSQERIGYAGKPFNIYKFRTMYVGAENDRPLLSMENDSRITPFGYLMRKYRLDELPQFWNVLKGDMSLVGPRPERRYFIDRIVRKAPYYYLLHNVRPGISSLGMVKYGYATTVDEMIERLHYDMLYYENMSLILDITILIYTVETVITGKGV